VFGTRELAKRRAMTAVASGCCQQVETASSR